MTIIQQLNKIYFTNKHTNKEYLYCILNYEDKSRAAPLIDFLSNFSCTTQSSNAVYAVYAIITNFYRWQQPVYKNK